jgi:hypothetical protein
MNFDRLRFVAERAEVGEEREALFAVTIPEERGSFRRFCALLGPRNVTEFNYRISDAARGARVRRLHGRQPGESRASPRSFEKHGFDARPHARRTGQAARPPHGRRPRARWRATSCSTASSSPSGRAR